MDTKQYKKMLDAIDTLRDILNGGVGYAEMVKQAEERGLRLVNYDRMLNDFERAIENAK